MRSLNKKAFAVVEYVVLVVIIIGAFLIMKDYIQRGIFGSWTQAGKSFAFGRQYDSQKTIECVFDDQSNLWYDRNCFDALSSQKCSIGDAVCEEGIITGGSCAASSCQQMNQ